MTRTGAASMPRAAAGRARPRAAVAGLQYGAACVGFSLAAHLVAGGQRPSFAATVTLFAVTVAVFSLASSRLSRRLPAASSKRLLLLGTLLVTVQPLLHGAFSAGPAADGQAHGPVPIGPVGADESAAEMILIAHVLAGLITACLLVHGAWMRSRLTEWIAARPNQGLSGLTVSWNSTVLAVGDRSWSSPLDDLVATCAPRRGPPRRTAVTVR